MEELAYKIKSDFLKTLAHPLRLQVIELLKDGERKAGELVRALGIPQSSLSRHLLALREAGILRARQQGTVIFYAVEDKGIFQVLRPIAELLRKKLNKTATVLDSLGK
ncbi:MAG: metalloregulator ArsR/SmtB family transcription factor [Candidatus Omnitrophota bacterium]